MKRHSHPFSIPEHGSKTGSNSGNLLDEIEGSPSRKRKISKKSMYTKERERKKVGKGKGKRQKKNEIRGTG
jgi:hypothetical protein